MDFVVSALSDTQEEVRLSALRICAVMGDGRAFLVSAIINALSRHQIAENTAIQALEALQNIALQSLKSKPNNTVDKSKSGVDTVAQFRRSNLPPCICG